MWRAVASNALTLFIVVLVVLFGLIAWGRQQFTGPGLRQYEALANDGRRTLEQINRTVRSIERNPQQFIFGSKPAIPEYSGR